MSGLPVSDIVDVTVLADPPLSTDTDRFVTGLLLAEAPSGMTARTLSVSRARELTTADFAESGAAYKAAVKYFAVDPAPRRLLVGAVRTGETFASAFEQIIAETDGFYAVYAAGADISQLLALAQAVDAYGCAVLFCPVTSAADTAAGDNALFARMKNTGRTRVFTVLCTLAEDAAGWAGLAMGLNRAHAGDAFAMCYRSADGMTPRGVTGTQARAIKELNGNVYIIRGYDMKVLEPGCLSDGTRFDTRLYLDEIAAELRNACLRLITSAADRLPMNDTATARFFSAISGVLQGYAARGILTPGLWKGADVGNIHTDTLLEDGYALYAPPYDLQSAEDRAARRAVPVSVCLNLAGSVESVVINVITEG